CTLDTAYTCPDTLNRNAGVIAVVNGMRMVKRVPSPAAEDTEISPPRRTIASRATSRPTPRPASSSASSRAATPGSKMAATPRASGGAARAGRPGRGEPRAHARDVDAGAVVGDVEEH